MSHPLDEFERAAEDVIKFNNSISPGYPPFPVTINPHSLAMLCRIVRLAIAADEMLHSPHTAQQMALRDALREEGLRQC